MNDLQNLENGQPVVEASEGGRKRIKLFGKIRDTAWVVCNTETLEKVVALFDEDQGAPFHAFGDIDRADAEDLAEVGRLKALLSDIRDFEVDSGIQRIKKGEPAFVMPVELRRRIQEVLK